MKIAKPMTLISHMLSSTRIHTPGRSIGDGGIGDTGLHTISFTQHRFRRDGGRRNRTRSKIYLNPLASVLMLFVFRRVLSRRWIFVPLRRHLGRGASCSRRTLMATFPHSCNNESDASAVLTARLVLFFAMNSRGGTKGDVG